MKLLSGEHLNKIKQTEFNFELPHFSPARMSNATDLAGGLGSPQTRAHDAAWQCAVISMQIRANGVEFSTFIFANNLNQLPVGW